MRPISSSTMGSCCPVRGMKLLLTARTLKPHSAVLRTRNNSPHPQHLSRCANVTVRANMVDEAGANGVASTPQRSTTSKSNFKRLVPLSQSWSLLMATVDVLRRNLWAVVLIYAVKDALAFLMFRMSHRLTNATAEALLGIPISSVANPWWLLLDNKILDQGLGPWYQVVVVVFLVVCLPLHIFLNATATTTMITVCRARSHNESLPWTTTSSARPCPGVPLMSSFRGPGVVTATNIAVEPGTLKKGQQEDGMEPLTSPARPAGAPLMLTFARGSGLGTVTTTPPPPKYNKYLVAGKGKAGSSWAPFRGVRNAVGEIRGTWPRVVPQLRRVWWVDLLFNVQALVLQGFSMLVIPVFWTLPRLLRIQLAVPAAVLEGHKGKAALDRSQELMEGFRAVYFWPFLGLILLIRGVPALCQAVLLALPPRFWWDVVEVPMALQAAFAIAQTLVARCQDLLPLAAYLVLKQKEDEIKSLQGPQGGGAEGQNMEGEDARDSGPARVVQPMVGI